MRVEHARPSGVDGGTPVALDPTPTILAEGEFETVMTPTLQKLQGEWVPLELIASGKPLEQSYLSFGLRIQTGAETIGCLRRRCIRCTWPRPSGNVWATKG